MAYNNDFNHRIILPTGTEEFEIQFLPNPYYWENFNSDLIPVEHNEIDGLSLIKEIYAKIWSSIPIENFIQSVNPENLVCIAGVFKSENRSRELINFFKFLEKHLLCGDSQKIALSFDGLLKNMHFSKIHINRERKVVEAINIIESYITSVVKAYDLDFTHLLAHPNAFNIIKKHCINWGIKCKLIDDNHVILDEFLNLIKTTNIAENRIAFINIKNIKWFTNKFNYNIGIPSIFKKHEWESEWECIMLCGYPFFDQIYPNLGIEFYEPVRWIEVDDLLHGRHSNII